MTYSQPWLLIHRKQQQHLDARGMNHSKFYEIQRTDQPLEHFFLYKKSVNKISFSGVDPAEQKSLTWSCSRQARPEPALADAEDAPVTKAGLRATATRTITRTSPVIGWNSKLLHYYCSKDLFFRGQLDLNVDYSSPKQCLHSKSLLSNNQSGKKYTGGSGSAPEMSVWSEYIYFFTWPDTYIPSRNEDKILCANLSLRLGSLVSRHIHSPMKTKMPWCVSSTLYFIRARMLLFVSSSWNSVIGGLRILAVEFDSGVFLLDD